MPAGKRVENDTYLPPSPDSQSNAKTTFTLISVQ